MNRAERRQQTRNDEKILARGIDPASQDAAATAAMARQLHGLLDRAKQEANVDPAVRFLHTKVEASLEATKALPIACNQGCSHCCHSWVSAPAPELLFIAKRIRTRAADRERVQAAYAATKDRDVPARKRNPLACPMLVQNLCAIYQWRPMACRFAASADAEVCARSFLKGSNEAIPSPVRNLRGRAAYQMALAIALAHAGLPHHYYELNAGLARALERDDAEQAWLSGEDVFASVRRDPTDLLSHPQARMLFGEAFGDGRQ